MKESQQQRMQDKEEVIEIYDFSEESEEQLALCSPGNCSPTDCTDPGN